MNDRDSILKKIKELRLGKVPHTGGNFFSHLVGVYEILHSWHEKDHVALAGLTHAVYGTDAFRVQSVPMENRAVVKNIVGPEAERLAFTFCAMNRESLWANLDRRADYSVTDRFDGSRIELSHEDACGLFAIALANNLELRPRETIRNKSLNKDRFLRAERFLSKEAYQAFKRDYRVEKNGNRKILVIGGTLYIGKYLVYELLSEGYDVAVATRGRGKDGFGSRVERIIFDRQSSKSVLDALAEKEWHAVYDNLCYTQEDAEIICDSLSGKTETYIMTSSNAVYRNAGSCKESDFAPESYQYDRSPSRPEGAVVINNGQVYTGNKIPNWLTYGESKRRAEAAIAIKMKANISIARLPMVLAADDPMKRLQSAVGNVLNGALIELYRHNRATSAMPVDASAHFLRWLLESRAFGIFNASSKGDLDADLLYRLIEKICGKPAGLNRAAAPGKPDYFARKADCTMDCAKAENAGFIFPNLQDWLPKEIAKIISSMPHQPPCIEK